MRVVAVAVVAFCVAAPAWAGGVPVELAVSGRTLWAVSDSGLSRFDTRSGASAAGPRTPYPYATRLASDGAAIWVASVANGYVSGAVSRIDRRTNRASTVLRLPHRPVWDVCAGGGVAWAPVGQRSGAGVFRLGDGAPRFIALEADRCAADRSGGWFTNGSRLVHVDRDGGTVRTVAHLAGASQLAVGENNVWVAGRDGIARISKRDGRVRTTRVSGTLNELAVGAGRVWAITLDVGGQRSRLLRLDPRSGRVTAGRRLPGAPSSIVERDGRVWIGGLDGFTPTLWRVSPATLAVRRVRALG